MAYAIATYDTGGESRCGIIVNDRVIDVAEATSDTSLRTVAGLLAKWETAEPVLSALASRPVPAAARTLADTVLLAPIPRPNAIYCAGSNYADHVREMAARHNQEPSPDPHTLGLKAWHFIKSSHTVVGPDAVISLPRASKMIDWEIELAAVIGRTAKDVGVEDALRYVAGYTIGNDLSARDLGRRPPMPETSPFYSDWLAHKSFDGSCPLGPWIVPASAIDDPQRLGIKLWVNGTLMQDSNTSEMIFTLAEQIAQLSARITLHPGDVILTGTPAGVGAGRGIFLQDGDAVELWCEGIGTLRHTMVAG